MSWEKMSPEVAALLEEAVAPFTCQKRKMFGHECYFVNNNMWTGVFEDRIFVRLSEADRQAALERESETALFEPLAGRPMREYVELPASIYDSPEFESWLQDSYAYTSSLPPKEPKKKK